jgi:hypothetical protein
MIYVIEKVRKFNGDFHERELRRKGHRVRINDVQLGIPLFAEYVDENNAILQTSRVTAYNADWENANHLNVQTQNTVYIFRKE